MNRIATLILVLLAAGCATDRLWTEPNTLPGRDSTYRREALMKLRNLPVALEIECPELAMVNEKGVFGGVAVAGRFPVRDILKRECERFIEENFRPATAYSSSYAVLKVTMSRVLVMQKWSETEADLSYRIELLHPTDATVRNYFSRKFDGHGSSRKRSKDRGIVPDSVYIAVQHVLGALGDDMAANPQLVRRLGSDFGLTSERNSSPAAMESFELGEGANGIHSGRCVYVCNDEPSESVALRAKEYIADACWKKLGISREKVRVVYDAETLDSGRWTLSFRTFGRMELAFSYDPATRSGVCTADLGLLGQDVKTATATMKQHVFDQIRHCEGAVASQSSDLGNLVRFGEFKSDARNELLSVTFRIVY